MLLAFLAFLNFVLKKGYILKTVKDQQDIANQEEKSLKWNLMIILAMISLLSFCVTGYQLKNYQDRYQKIQEDTFVAVITSDPIEKTYKEEYNIQVKQIGNEKGYQNTHLLMQVKKREEEKQRLEYGDLISFQGIYEAPMEQRNSKGFDEGQYFRSKELYGKVTVSSKIQVIKKKQIHVVGQLSHSFQRKIKEVAQIFPEETRQLLLGITLGDTKQMDKQIREDFADSNLAHLLAVSGAHIGYVLSGMILLLEKCRIHKKLGKVLTILGLSFFLFVTNFTPSVTRACLMGIYLLIGGIFYKKTDTFHSLCAAFLLQIIANPFCIFSLSFLLSYGGTIGILAFQKPILERIQKQEDQKLISKIKEMIAVTLSAQIVIFPICLYQFGTISFTFLLSNLLAGPLLGVLLLFGFFILFLGMLCLPLAKVLFFIPQFLLWILLKIANLCAKLPFSKVYFPIPPMSIFIGFYGFLVLFWNQLKKGKKWQNKTKRKVGILLLAIIMLVYVVQGFSRPFTLHFIDVGQGDSSLIFSPAGKKILIDGGGSRDMESFDIGKQTLLPYLLHRGISSLDYVIISHFDSDHCRSEY